MPSPRLIGRFFAALEESLQSKANAQKRHSGADARDQRLPHVHLIQRAQHLPEVADAGKDNLRRTLEARRIAD